jgi:hypothetical protein
MLYFGRFLNVIVSLCQLLKHFYSLKGWKLHILTVPSQMYVDADFLTIVCRVFMGRCEYLFPTQSKRKYGSQIRPDFKGSEPGFASRTVMASIVTIQYLRSAQALNFLIDLGLSWHHMSSCKQV